MIAICLSGINPLNFSTLLGVNDKQKASSRNLDKTHLMTVYFNYQYKFHHHSNTFQTVRRRAKGIKFGLYPPVYFLDRLVRITFKLQNDLLMTSEFAVDEGKQRPPRKAFASRSTGVVFFFAVNGWLWPSPCRWTNSPKRMQEEEPILRWAGCSAVHQCHRHIVDVGASGAGDD